MFLRPPRPSDRDAFLAAVARSRRLHGSWVHPPDSPETYTAYLRAFGGPLRRSPLDARHAAFLALDRNTLDPVGVFNFSEIVRGGLQSAFLGYYAFDGWEGRGFMREGLALALATAFHTLLLHRVEANVQPDNTRSIRLVEAAGFVREGYSPRYVKVGGRWRDHIRYALLVENWRPRRRPA